MSYHRPLALRPVGAISVDSSTLWKLAIVGVLGYVVMKELFGARGPSGAGWYVELYNYPVGDRNRRLKSVDGPFEKKTEATDEAQAQEGTWYPKVVWRERGYGPEDF